MYYLKKDIDEIYNLSAVARRVGITTETMNRIANKKQGCSKMTAYCIIKTIDENAEIEDYFEKKGE